MTTAAEIMSRRVLSVHKDEKIRKSILLMNNQRVSCLIVTSEGQPIGIVTERDIVRKVFPNNMDIDNHTVADIMTSPIETVYAKEPIESVHSMLFAHNIRRVPVVDAGKLVGILTQSDIVKHSRLMFDENRKLMQHRKALYAIIALGILVQIWLVYKAFF